MTAAGTHAAEMIVFMLHFPVRYSPLFAGVSEKSDEVDLLMDAEEEKEEEDEMEIEEAELCLGLSYRRGLRKSFFEKSRGHLLTSIGGSLWKESSGNSAIPSTKELQDLLAANDFSFA